MPEAHFSLYIHLYIPFFDRRKGRGALSMAADVRSRHQSNDIDWRARIAGREPDVSVCRTSSARHRKFILFFVISGILAGCTFDVPVQPPEAQNVSIPDAAIVLPLTVGLYFSDEFRHLKKDAPFYGGPAITYTYEFPIGEASVRRWQEFAGLVFADVGILPALPGAAGEMEIAEWHDRERQRLEQELAEAEQAAALQSSAYIPKVNCTFCCRRRVNGKLRYDCPDPTESSVDLVALKRNELEDLDRERAAGGFRTAYTAANVDLILAPTIEHVSVRVPQGYAWLGNYWVEIIYGVRLYSADGEPIANWRVTGRGTNTDGIDFFGTHRLPSQAMDEAILDAGNAFMAGFAIQPAAAAWLAANLTPVERQQACDTPEDHRVDSSMPSNATTSPAGLAVGMETLASPERQQAVIGATIGNQQILAARLVLRNDAESAWIVRREDLRLQTESGRSIAPLDGRSLILGTDDIVYFEPAMVVDAGTTVSGIAAGLNVLGLIVASIAASERKDLLATLREREYAASCLAPGASAAGIVYFALPPGASRDGLELHISAHAMPGDETMSIGLVLEEMGMPMADEMAE
jgi:hypothetical protein